MRRLFVVLLTALLSLPLGLASAFAMEATPVSGSSPAASSSASPAAGGAYPDVAVTITRDAVEVASDQIPAGYIRLTVTNNSGTDNGVGMVGIPAGMTMDELGQATPEPGNFIPPFFYSAKIAGGPSPIPAGSTATQIVHVDPGQWVLFPQNDQKPVEVTVAETAASVTEAPTANATITETDFAFAGYEHLVAGPQMLEVKNDGAQPHMFIFTKLPDGTTMDQVQAAYSKPDNATPAPGGLQQSDFVSVDNGQVIMQSSGTSVWMHVDLKPGTYVLVCFVTDPATGKPHAMEGMIALFQVGG